MNAYIKLINNYTTVDVYDDNGTHFIKSITSELLFALSACRYDNVYVWDAPEVFAIIDAYALNNFIQDYELLPLNDQGYKSRITSECISRRDGDGAYYERKLWLKTQKANSIDRHKRLSATTYINVHNFFGSVKFKDACKAFGVCFATYGAIALKYLLQKFADSIYDITSISIFDDKGKLKYWSMGGISKAYYLKLFESYTQGIKYKDYVLQNEEFETEMRLTHLLSKGILYCKKFDVEFSNQYKFDKNSLFPHVGQDCPIFYPPIKSTWEEYTINRKFYHKRNEIYILTFNRLLLSVKRAFPNVLQPHGEICTDKNPPILEYKNQSFFAPHFEQIQKIYDILDVDIKAVYKLKTVRDPAILEFNQKLFSLKKSLNGNTPRRTVVKYLLNNLHGKLAQICLQSNFEYSKDENGVLTRRIKSLNNTWKKSHFDYLRGAYIYSMAQSEMLEELIKLPRPKEVAYIDTDCFITEITNAPRNVGDNLGQFKKENYYKRVCFYAPKTYIGIDGDDDIKITCAGLNAEEIKNYLPKIFRKRQHLKEISVNNLPTTITRRTAEGFKRVIEWRTIGKGLTQNDYTEGGYIYGSDN